MGQLHIDTDLTLRFDVLGAPVAITGMIGDGHQVLYRERHAHWRVEVDEVVIASGPANPNWSMGDHVKTLVDALWHPYLSDQYNAREDSDVRSGSTKNTSVVGPSALQAVERPLSGLSPVGRLDTMGYLGHGSG